MSTWLDAYTQAGLSSDGLNWDLYSLTGLPQYQSGSSGTAFWDYRYSFKTLVHDPSTNQFLGVIQDTYTYDDWFNGIYVSTQRYDIYASADGIHWQHDAALSSDGYSFVGLAVANTGTRVAFLQNWGQEPVFLYQLPGKPWQVTANIQVSDSTRMTQSLRTVRWNAVKNVFVAVGNGPNILYSFDGQSWVQASGLAQLPTLPLMDVAFDKAGRAVAVGDHTIAVATDGYANWFYQSGASQNFVRINWDGSRFVASSGSGIASSMDGASWTEWGGYSATVSLGAIIWSPYGMLAAGPQGHLLAADKNGMAWVDRSLSGTSLPDFEAIELDTINTTPCFLLAGSLNGQGEVRYACSNTPDVYNLYFYTARLNPAPAPLHGIAVNNVTGDPYAGTAVVVGDNGEIYYRPQGASYSYRYGWQPANSGTTSRLNAVAHGQPGGAGLFVAGGDAGTILASQDGYTWNPGTGIPSYLNVTEIAWMDVYTSPTKNFRGFIAIAEYSSGRGYVYTSQDGYTWTQTTIPYGYHSGIGNDGQWIWIGTEQGTSYYQKIYRSDDGTTWITDTQTTPLVAITHGVSPAFACTRQGMIYQYFADTSPPQVHFPSGLSSWTVAAADATGISSQDPTIQSILGGVYAYDAVDGYLFSTLHKSVNGGP
ncbi:MAG: hypothetical protein D6755_13960, partial [Anaerolineae bacterium]